MVSDGDSGEAAKDVLLGLLRAPVEAKVGCGVSAGAGAAAGSGRVRAVWDRYGGRVCAVVAESGEGEDGVAGGLGDAVGGGKRSLWDADHVRPVAEGGGQCDLENLRTLCLCCHREVTADLRRRLKGRD